MQIDATLWAASPFDTFTDLDRAALEAIAELREFEAGGSIYEPGDLSGGAYILLSGSVTLGDPLMATLGGRSPLVLESVGTLISKGSLLEPFTHRHHCKAKTAARLLLLPRERFQEHFVHGSPFALKLVDTIVRMTSAEIRELNGAIHVLLSES